ncbi:MAG TPA: preprotein translocase subunit SecE [Candidatus Saccharimonadia bacterium]|nr:preprotein translocase subunit SecE [Candidatus Saccharimonadia bacterium]
MTQSHELFLIWPFIKRPPEISATKPFIEYIKASRIELTKVTWPSRRNTARLTLLVIAFSLVFAAFLGGLDVIFSALVQKIIVKG